MNQLYNEFLQYLKEENREQALNIILNNLKNEQIDIVTLYTDILSPALNEFKESQGDGYYIWKEHVRSSIIRTIIENCYPYVIKERDNKYKIKTDKRVAVVCPSEEYHEIGARMVTDFFTLAGFDAIFVGGNTPTSEFLTALKKINLDYISISVSNYYNLVEAYKAIEQIRNNSNDIKIIVGGSAFDHNKNAHKTIGADMYLKTFEDILDLAKEDRS